MIPDPGYTDYLDPRLAPPEEREPTEVELMRSCRHSAACLYVAGRLMLGDYTGALDDDKAKTIARWIGCNDCLEWGD